MAGTSASTPAATSTARAATPPSLLAVAIGELQETGGAYATVDLRATVKDGATGGTVRLSPAGEA